MLLGMTKRDNPAYGCWANMVQRCTNRSNPNFHRYGGRGISICDEWRDSFESFAAHIGPRPSPGHSVDRIDNSRGYEPGNVRWATASEQASNIDKNVWLEHDGRRMHLSEWARVSGVPLLTLHSRINKLGWSAERALSTPSMGRRGGAKLTLEKRERAFALRKTGMDGKSIAAELGVSHSAACRLLSGKTFVEAA